MTVKASWIVSGIMNGAATNVHVPAASTRTPAILCVSGRRLIVKRGDKNYDLRGYADTEMRGRVGR